MVCFLVPWYLCSHALWFKESLKVGGPNSDLLEKSDSSSCLLKQTLRRQFLPLAKHCILSEPLFFHLRKSEMHPGEAKSQGTGHWMKFQVTISNLSEAPHYNFLPFQKPWNPLEACGGYLWILGQCCIQLSLLWVSEHIITVALFYHSNHPTNYSLNYLYYIIIYNRWYIIMCVCFICGCLFVFMVNFRSTLFMPCMWISEDTRGRCPHPPLCWRQDLVTIVYVEPGAHELLEILPSLLPILL